MTDITSRLRLLAIRLDIMDCETVQRAADEIERLRTRLEVDPRHPFDGIATRDETIRQLEAELSGLRHAHTAVAKLAERRDALLSEIDDLKHDLGEHQKIVKDLTNENEQMRAAVEALAAIVQSDRVEHYQSVRNASTGMVDDDADRAHLARYDAALRLVDVALGVDVER